jgi:CRISPR-associated exonuclease Cas4
VYCERRAALVHVVGAWIENAHTTGGHLVHQRVDSGETSTKPGLRVLRSVHVRSDRLRLRGIIDLVEVHGHAPPFRFVPVETKKGRRRRWERDEVQVCAQAMALEELTQVDIVEGAIFHAASNRRRVVRFDEPLRQVTATYAARLHAIVAAGEVPLAVADARCPPCSLRPACQPGVALPPGSLVSRIRRALE